MKKLVWLVSYPKSGNTWFRMFLANYLKKAQEPVPLEEIQPASISSDSVDFEEITGLNPFELAPDEVDIYRPEVYRYLSLNTENDCNFIYKKTHDAYTLNILDKPLFPEDVSKSAVYFIRNPLDVCVSYANHGTDKIDKKIDFILDEGAILAGKRKGQLRQIMMSWKSHVQSWKNQSLIPIHFVRYEDMVQKPVETFGDIIQFLGLEYDTELLRRAIMNSNFRILQQMEQENGFQEKMQLCKSFFWKGKIGNYHNFLSDEQVNRIVKYNYDTMREFGYIDKEGKLTV